MGFLSERDVVFARCKPARSFRELPNFEKHNRINRIALEQHGSCKRSHENCDRVFTPAGVLSGVFFSTPDVAEQTNRSDAKQNKRRWFGDSGRGQRDRAGFTDKHRIVDGRPICEEAGLSRRTHSAHDRRFGSSHAQPGE